MNIYHFAMKPMKKGKPANEKSIKEKNIVKIILFEKYK
jgi:hypothetical protein